GLVTVSLHDALPIFVHTYEGVGNVESPADVRIGSKVTGRLVYLQAREGDRVARGQVLARIDSSQVMAAVNQQQAVVASAQANLKDRKSTRLNSSHQI